MTPLPLKKLDKDSILNYEIALIGLVLFVVAFVTSVPFLESDIEASVIIWLSACAVFITFIHGALCFDLSTNQVSKKSVLGIGFYWISKEFLWLAVFLLSGAYPAIIGTGLFILYPLWRKSSLRPR